MKLIILAVLAACFGAPPEFRTANAATSDVPPPAPPAPPAPPTLAVVMEIEADNSTLGLLCKGAGVDPADVRWRVQAGVDVKLAVDAAVAQKQNDAASAASKKGGK